MPRNHLSPSSINTDNGRMTQRIKCCKHFAGEAETLRKAKSYLNPRWHILAMAKHGSAFRRQLPWDFQDHELSALGM